MRHLVTGGSGFIGTLLTRRLLELGESVRAIDIWEDPYRVKDVEFLTCDILDRAAVSRAMREVDVVHHLAAAIPISRCSIHRYQQVNAEGTRIVIEEATRSNVQSFILMSSSSIFGVPNKCPIDSTCLPNPVDPYGKSKLAGELIAQQIADATGLPLIILRPRTVLGEGRLGIFQILFEWVQGNHNVYTLGSGSNLIQFIHVDDLISACLLLCKNGHTGAYNIGTSRYGTVKSTLEALISFAGSQSKIVSLPEEFTINILSVLDKLALIPLAPFHYLTYSCDNYCDLSNLTALGWQSRYSNTEMICESYTSFVKNYDRTKTLRSGSDHRRPIKQKLFQLTKLLPHNS